MQQLLNENEKTLLSAYRDGELSGGELAGAEKLIAESAGARQYLNELRELRSFSAELFPAAGATLAATSAKLSGPAIKAAALKGSVIKGALSSPWAISGMAACLATAVLAGVLSLKSPTQDRIPVMPNAAGTNSMTASAMPVSLKLDPSSLVVPAMSCQELINFAVQGSLPIDSTRQRFVTVMPNDQGKLAVEINNCRPETSLPNIDKINLATIRGLDTIQQLVRTSLLQISNHGLVVRGDLPALRLRLLQQIQQSEPKMPSEVRRALVQARAELVRQFQKMRTVAAPEENTAEDNEDDMTDAFAEAGQVRYYVISQQMPQGNMAAEIPMQYTSAGVGTGNTRTVAISRESLRPLEAFAEMTEEYSVPDVQQTRRAVYTTTRNEYSANPTAGVRIVSARNTRRTQEVQVGNLFNQPGGLPAQGTTIFISTTSPQTIDSMLGNSRRLLERAQRLLDRVDSLRERRRLIKMRMPDNVDSNINGDSMPPDDGASE